MQDMKVFSVALAFCAPLALRAISPSIVARVNGEPIYAEELTEKFPSLTKEKALDQMILRKLAVQQARETGMALAPELKNAGEEELYKAFMTKESNRKALVAIREKSKIAILTEKQ